MGVVVYNSYLIIDKEEHINIPLCATIRTANRALHYSHVLVSSVVMSENELSKQDVVG